MVYEIGMCKFVVAWDWSYIYNDIIVFRKGYYMLKIILIIKNKK